MFVIQSTCTPVNDNLMELLLMLDAFRRASAKRITAVVPYFGYARQDRKVAPRVPISAKLVADLITTAGASRVLTVDLHAGQIQGFFNVPVDNLFATPVLAQLRPRTPASTTTVSVVSPDRRRRRTRPRVRQALECRAWRSSTSAARAPTRSPRCTSSATCATVPRSSSTTWSIPPARSPPPPTALKEAARPRSSPAARIRCCPGAAIERIQESVLSELIVTDTIPLRPEAQAVREDHGAVGGAPARRGDSTARTTRNRLAHCSSEASAP